MIFKKVLDLRVQEEARFSNQSHSAQRDVHRSSPILKSSYTADSVSIKKIKIKKPHPLLTTLEIVLASDYVRVVLTRLQKRRQACPQLHVDIYANQRFVLNGLNQACSSKK